MNPRKAIDELKVSNSPNLKRALGYKPQVSLDAAQREDLTEMYSALKARRVKLLAEIEENGLVLVEDRFNRGQLYQKRVANPAVAMLATVEKLIIGVAKILAATEPDPKELSDADVIAESRAFLAEALRAN